MTNEATADGRCSSSTVQWSDLPDDLLSMIYLRLRPSSPLDRVYFAASCRSWLAVAARHPAPPPAVFPWLFFSPHRRESSRKKRAFCPEDGAVLSVQVPRKAAENRFIGSYAGGWVALAASDGLSITVMNLFSGDEMTVPVRQRKSACTWHAGVFVISKVVFSEAPTSGNCIMAAMTGTCTVVFCRVGCLKNGWTTSGCGGYRFADIAFHNGGLYGLITSHDGALVKFEIGVHNTGVPVVTHTTRLAIRESQIYLLSGDVTPRVRYIVELDGKLLLVIRSKWGIRPDIYFRAWELVEADGAGAVPPYTHEWAEITSLGDYALFLGPILSTAVHVPARREGGAKRNHIYFVGKKIVGDIPDAAYLVGSDHRGCRVYCSEDRIGPHPLAKYYPAASLSDVITVPSLGYYVPGDATWILPPDL